MMDSNQLPNPKNPLGNEPSPLSDFVFYAVGASLSGGIAGFICAMLVDALGWHRGVGLEHDINIGYAYFCTAFALIGLTALIYCDQYLTRRYKPLTFPTEDHAMAYKTYEALEPEYRARATPAYNALMAADSRDIGYALDDALKLWNDTVYKIGQHQRLAARHNYNVKTQADIDFAREQIKDLDIDIKTMKELE